MTRLCAIGLRCGSQTNAHSQSIYERHHVFQQGITLIYDSHSWCAAACKQCLENWTCCKNLSGDMHICYAGRLLCAGSPSQLTEQIPVVIDTLYTMVSVPAESTAFLGTGSVRILAHLTPLVLAAHSDRPELQEALNIAAILTQLCWVELANEPGDCTTILPDTCRWLLARHCVWVTCVTETHCLCWVGYCLACYVNMHIYHRWHEASKCQAWAPPVLSSWCGRFFSRS